MVAVVLVLVAGCLRRGFEDGEEDELELEEVVFCFFAGCELEVEELPLVMGASLADRLFDTSPKTALSLFFDLSLIFISISCRVGLSNSVMGASIREKVGK